MDEGWTAARVALWRVVATAMVTAAAVLFSFRPAAAEDLVDLPVPDTATTLPTLSVPVTAPPVVVPTVPPAVELGVSPPSATTPPSGAGTVPPESTGAESPATTAVQPPVAPSSSSAPVAPAGPINTDPPAEMRNTSEGAGAVPQTLAVRLRRAAADTAQQLTFPLGLSLGIVAFLVFQHRADRGDGRIRVPVESGDDDLLGFS